MRAPLATFKRGAKKALRNRPFAYDTAAAVQTAGRYLTRRPHEADFLVFRHLRTPVLFVDVGANRGQSALSFASVSRLPHRIVSFEPNLDNRLHLEVVKRLLGARFHYHLCGLGEAVETREFYVPAQGSRRLTGEGSFSRPNVEAAARRIEGPYEIETRCFRIERFDSLGLAPDVVKIDVQGLELEVLRGMGDLAWRPLLMIEANPDNDEPILQHLTALGYERYERGPIGRLAAASSDRLPLNWFYGARPFTTTVAPVFA